MIHRGQETHDGQENEVGVVLVLVNFGNQFWMARGHLLARGLNKVAGDIRGVSLCLAVGSCQSRQSAVGVLDRVSEDFRPSVNARDSRASGNQA